MATNNKVNGSQILLATMPATSAQRWSALVVVFILLATLAVLAPFATVPLPQYSAFIPTLEIAVFIPSLITSILLFAQFSIFRSYALLTIATGYLFVALIVISHAAVFPGAIAPTGTLYGGLQSATWLFVLWQTGFSFALLVYTLLRGKKRPKASRPSAAIASSVAIVFGLAGGFIWVAVAGYEYLPAFNLDMTHPSRLLRHIAKALLIIYVLAFALLLVRRRSVLDQWLMVVACAAIAQIAFIGLFGSARFSLGFYAGRSFSLFGSTILLVVLVAEMARLYAGLARSNAMLQRERNNKLMNLEAMASSISHEIRQPLAAIEMNGETALEFLGNSSPNINEARSALKDIVDDTGRVGQIIESVRALFGRPYPERQTVDVNQIILRVLRSLHKELKSRGIVASTSLAADLPLVIGHEGQLEEVIINLLQNAIDAMATIKDKKRTLHITTERHDSSEIAVSIEDTGPGIDPDKLDRIFDAFFTTKAAGSGLGLAICRTIIERHEGQLFASSNTKGGATFRFILPIKAAMGFMASPV